MRKRSPGRPLNYRRPLDAGGEPAYFDPATRVKIQFPRRPGGQALRSVLATGRPASAYKAGRERAAIGSRGTRGASQSREFVNHR